MQDEIDPPSVGAPAAAIDADEVEQLKRLCCHSERGSDALFSTRRLSATAKLALMTILALESDKFGRATTGRLEVRSSYLQAICGFRKQMVRRALVELAHKGVLAVDPIDAASVYVTVLWRELATLLGVRVLVLDLKEGPARLPTARPMVRTPPRSEHGNDSEASDAARMDPSTDENALGRRADARLSAVDGGRSRNLSLVGAGGRRGAA